MTPYDPLSKDALDQDWKAAEAYTKYSAELLRLALLAIAGLGTLLLKVSDRDVDDMEGLCLEFLPSFVFLLLCAAFALLHRSFANELMAAHSAYLRRTAALPENVDPANEAYRKAETKRVWRNIYLKASTWAINLSALALVLGVLLAGHPAIDALSAQGDTDQGADNTAVQTIRHVAVRHWHTQR
jgi:hypothetical protein